MRFDPLFPWAVLPHQKSVDVEQAKQRQRLMRDEFSHLRADRQPEFCAPWVLGQKIGWRICSPVDVDLTPLPQYEVNQNEPEKAAAALGKTEVWLRSGTGLIMDRPPWLHMYQFREGETWGNMFIPNGQSTVEWRLGWMPAISEQHTIMIFPSELTPELGVLIGVLTPASLKRLQTTGFSIAFQPKGVVRISRGQEIARLVLVDLASLNGA